MLGEQARPAPETRAQDVAKAPEQQSHQVCGLATISLLLVPVPDAQGGGTLASTGCAAACAAVAVVAATEGFHEPVAQAGGALASTTRAAGAELAATMKRAAVALEAEGLPRRHQDGSAMRQCLTLLEVQHMPPCPRAS